MNEDVHWFPHPRCKKPHDLWSAPDKQATEYEVTAFVQALVRLTKPAFVVETGTYHGHTAVAIGIALQANGVGQLVTFEIDGDTALVAMDRIEDHELQGIVRVVPTAVHESYLTKPVELAWIDSGMRSRQQDMNVTWPHVAPGGLVLVHDASPDRPPGLVRPPDAYSMFDIATPRGLLVFQKPWG